MTQNRRQLQVADFLVDWLFVFVIEVVAVTAVQAVVMVLIVVVVLVLYSIDVRMHVTDGHQQDAGVQ